MKKKSTPSQISSSSSSQQHHASRCSRNFASSSSSSLGSTCLIDDTDVDLLLKQKLSPDDYDKLNRHVSERALRQYREKVSPYASFLIENARTVGRNEILAFPFDSNNTLSITEATPENRVDTEKLSVLDNQQMAPLWRKNPKKLTDSELYEDINKLQLLIERQQKQNQESRNELQILSLAVRRVDLEKQGLYLKLQKKEKKNVKL